MAGTRARVTGLSPSAAPPLLVGAGMLDRLVAEPLLEPPKRAEPPPAFRVTTARSVASMALSSRVQTSAMARSARTSSACRSARPRRPVLRLVVGVLGPLPAVGLAGGGAAPRAAASCAASVATASRNVTRAPRAEGDWQMQRLRAVAWLEDRQVACSRPGMRNCTALVLPATSRPPAPAALCTAGSPSHSMKGRVLRSSSEWDSGTSARYLPSTRTAPSASAACMPPAPCAAPPLVLVWAASAAAADPDTPCPCAGPMPTPPPCSCSTSMNCSTSAMV
mmetsp:Transcript_36418/g.81042  ORF Transcript_36418/g.81042 Transcript_36418/m.81042 type:complete len:279 (-) Transcript_36418:1071-1907(-)